MEFVAILQAAWLTGICAARDCEKLFFLVRLHHGCTYIYIRERIKFHSEQRLTMSAERNEYSLTSLP